MSGIGARSAEDETAATAAINLPFRGSVAMKKCIARGVGSRLAGLQRSPTVKLVLIAAFASCVTLNPLPGSAQRRTVRAAFVRHTASLTTAQPTEASQLVLCQEHVLETALNAADGPENAGLTISFAVEATPLGIVGFSFEQGGPFTDALVVSVTLDAFGNGQSEPFFFKALTPGVTPVTACSSAGCVLNPFSVTVANIVAVQFEALDSALDAKVSRPVTLRYDCG